LPPDVASFTGREPELAQLQRALAATYEDLQVAQRPAADDDARAFRLLGLLDGPEVTVAAAVALLDQPPAQAEATLDRLVDAELLDSPTRGRYRLQELVRLFARERATADEDEPSRRAALGRVLGRSPATVQRS
jgi:hypothetical protein